MSLAFLQCMACVLHACDALFLLTIQHIKLQYKMRQVIL